MPCSVFFSRSNLPCSRRRRRRRRRRTTICLFFLFLFDFRGYLFIHIIAKNDDCISHRKKEENTNHRLCLRNMQSLSVLQLSNGFSLFKFTTMFCLRISSSTITPDINTSRLFYHRMLSQFKWLLQSRIILRFVRFCCCCRDHRRRCRCSCPCSNLVPVSNSRQNRWNSYFVQLMLSLAVSVLVILRFGREFFLFWPGFSALICEQIHEMQTFFSHSLGMLNHS